jgi:hypothetical protein
MGSVFAKVAAAGSYKCAWLVSAAGGLLGTCKGGGGRDRASATTFAGPGTYLRSKVNSAMAARCRCCLADHGSETSVSAVTKGLWSVHRWKSRPSRMCLKCRMAAPAARSSRSNVEYFDSAGCSLREKKPNGCQDPCTCCWSAPPMWVSDASVPGRWRRLVQDVPAAPLR